MIFSVISDPYSTMTPPGMTKCTPLLWGMCLLFAVNSAASSVPENSNTSVTVPTEVTTNQQATTSVSVLQPATLLPAKPSDAAARAEEAVSPTAAHEEGDRNKTSRSGDRRFAVTTVTSSSKPLAPTEKVTTKDVVPVELTAATKRNGTAVLASTGEPQPLSPTVTARTRSSTVSIAPTGKERLVSSSRTTGHAQTFTEVTSAGSGQQSSTAMTAATSEAQPQDRTTMANAANQTTAHLLHSSASSRTNTTSPPTTSAASHVSTQQPTSITEIRSEAATTPATDESTQSAATFSGSTASVTTSAVVQSTTSELPSTSHSAPATTSSNPTSTGPASTSTDSSNTTTANSTSPAGVLIPRDLASTTTRAPSTTEAPCRPSNGSTSSQILPCSTKGVVKQCLVVIAVLALVATVFIVTTIVLCIKLSARKYKVRKPPPATEMMCISSLLPDKSPAYTRQRNPVSNGVLVFPVGDSDEEGGDNLTLSSFLPENDRYV
ncbi:P-selectin glycoprotein ligand 1 [Fundulus diaphanus]